MTTKPQVKRANHVPFNHGVTWQRTYMIGKRTFIKVITLCQSS